jgi:hypothetical protein
MRVAIDPEKFMECFREGLTPQAILKGKTASDTAPD